ATSRNCRSSAGYDVVNDRPCLPPPGAGDPLRAVTHDRTTVARPTPMRAPTGPAAADPEPPDHPSDIPKQQTEAEPQSTPNIEETQADQHAGSGVGRRNIVRRGRRGSVHGRVRGLPPSAPPTRRRVSPGSGVEGQRHARMAEVARLARQR